MTSTTTATQIHVLTATGFSTKPTNLFPSTVFFSQSLTKTTRSFGLIATTPTISRIRKNFVRILPGDRVKVEVSRYDSSRGRIVYRLRNRDPTSE
ncbi:hypothetical protein D5086_031658 [Populus alba]|uniref:Uncharacterized protein n=1 Tax=Populus alba TaxID=43335 RepID=A0ACC4AJ88_POPAL